MTISQMNFFQRMWYILCRYSGSLLNGAATTMIIAIVCTLLGCVIGFAVGLVQTTEPKKGSGKIKRAILKVVKWILDAYVEMRSLQHRRISMKISLALRPSPSSMNRIFTAASSRAVRVKEYPSSG